MKLLKLSSDYEGFHTIEFHSGINLIVGKRKNPKDKNLKNTYNGVGKTLIIYLIYFCLGSRKNKEFENKIPDWTFYLEFEIDGEKFISKRNTSDQKNIYLNDEKLSINEFKEKMFKRIFNIDEKIGGISFSSLLHRFIRKNRIAYNKFNKYIQNEPPYAQLLNNGFLLGLDTDLIVEKNELRTRQSKIKNIIDSNSELKSYFENNNPTNIQIDDLNEEIDTLKKELKNFKIASNYNEIEENANLVSSKIQNDENEIILLTNKLKNIEKTMEIKPDISLKKIENLYKNAEIEIPEMIEKHLEDSINFHKNLLVSRKLRLFKEKEAIKKRKKELESIMAKKRSEFDQLIKYLDTHGALDKFTSLNNKLNDLENKLEKLNESQKMIEYYNKEKLEIKGDFITSSISTSEYLEDKKTEIEKIRSVFRTLAKEFYNKGAGMQITNNENENTIRFNIEVTIQDDSSDGINEVKIFCYDLMILMMQINHKMKFIFHDSRLFGNMDSRQRGTAFKVAEKITKENDLQYIATINQDQLDSFKDDYEKENFKKIIEENIILSLTDDSPSSKLLGIQIELNLEK